MLSHNHDSFRSYFSTKVPQKLSKLCFCKKRVALEFSIYGRVLLQPFHCPKSDPEGSHKGKYLISGSKNYARKTENTLKDF